VSAPEDGPPRWARRAADGLLVGLAASIPLSTTGMQAAAIGLVGLTLVGLAAGWGVVRRTPLDDVVGLLYGTLALSTLASGHPLEASGWVRPWVVAGYFVVFWWLRDGAHAARLVRVVVAAGALVAVYGVVQHFTGIDLYRAALGRETFVRPRAPGASGFAVVGFFRNYLTYAHTMLFPLAWAGAQALAGAALGVVAAPLIAAALVFSTARGVWLAGVAVVLALAFLARRRAGWALAAAAGAAAVAFAFSPDLRVHAAEMFLPGGENAGRIGIYRANLDIIHAHPVLGLGFGRYRTAAPPYYDAHPEADRRSHAHSNYLHIAAEAGLLGLAAFVLLYATALRRGWAALARAPDRATWAAAAGAWVGIVGFLVGGVTQYSFGDNEVALTMWTALAVLMRCREG
jgi:O-antigen ligase